MNDQPLAYMDPEFMKPVEAKGESVTVKESDRKSVTLTMIGVTTPSSGKAQGRLAAIALIRRSRMGPISSALADRAARKAMTVGVAVPAREIP